MNKYLEKVAEMSKEAMNPYSVAHRLLRMDPIKRKKILESMEFKFVDHSISGRKAVGNKVANNLHRIDAAIDHIKM